MARPRKRGRPAREPVTELGQFVQEQMETISITRTRLAHSLSISPSTLSRFLNDQVVAPRSIQLDNLAVQLRLNAMNRRKLFRLAAQTLGVVAIGSTDILASTEGAGRAGLGPAMTTYSHLDLEAVDLALDGWTIAFQQHYKPRDVLGKVGRIFSLLREHKPNSDDGRFDETFIRAGMLLAALQEAALPWGTERPKIATRTYNELDQQVLQRVSIDKYSSDYARLILRRAVLFRENDWPEECIALLSEATASRLVRACADPRVAVAFEAQITHTLAVLGRYREWQESIDRLRDTIESLHVDISVRQELHGIADYAVGVGYKRFVWKLRQDKSQSTLRGLYAQESIKWLRNLQTNPGGGRATHNINLYHPAVADSQSLPELRAAELDALVWCDPEETIRQAQELRQQAETLYPSVLRKLDLTVSLSKKLLGLTDS